MQNKRATDKAQYFADAFSPFILHRCCYRSGFKNCFFRRGEKKEKI